MPRKLRSLPPTASVAERMNDGRMTAPSAQRNYSAIRDVVAKFIPKSGCALEIASGTGEHIKLLGLQFPNITWQPTDIDPERLGSIDAWQQAEGSNNVLKAQYLDASEPGWHRSFGSQNLTMTTNLLHLIANVEAECVIAETAAALAINGVQMIYGPFKRGQEFASASDEKFHQSLVSSDPKIGYKSVERIQEWQRSCGLQPLEPIQMPANNLILAARKLA